MSVTCIGPMEARKIIEQRGGVLVDIREPAEHAREHIPCAALAPLSRMTGGEYAGHASPVIFHCQSGNRTSLNAGKLAASGASEIYVLEGGLNGWKKAGFETRLDRARPIEMQRQVQIAAGSLVLLGIVLAAAVSPWFAALSAFVGGGLVFAGVSGWCGMAKLLAVMPWNRVAA